MNARIRRSGRLSASLLLATAVALGCASEDEKLAQHLADATRYEEEGDLRSALVELQAALKLRPKSADVNLRLADAYQAHGKGARAAFYYGETYRLDPTNTRAALMQVPAYSATDPDQARLLLDEVLNLEPGNAQAHSRLAELQLQEGDTDAALASALTAAELEPGFLLSQRVVGSVHRARVREAMLREQDVDPAVQQAAIDAFQRAQKISDAGDKRPGPWFDRLQVALIYSDWDGHAEESKQHFKDAYALAGKKEERAGQLAVIRDARLLASRERDVEFQRWILDEWVSLEPERAAPWQQLAQLEASQGGSPDDVWKRAIETRPEELAIQAGYVRYLSGSRRVDDALAVLDALAPGLAGTPDAGVLRVEALLAAGRIGPAREAAETLRASHPDDPQSQLAAATVDLRSGRTYRALETLRDLSGRVERADVLRQLAVAEAQAFNAEAAIAAAERAIELQPRLTPAPYRVRARMLGYTGDWPGVLRSIRAMRDNQLPIGITTQQLWVQALYQTGRTAAARRRVQAFLDREPRDLGMVLLYDRYEGDRDPKGSHAYLVEAVERAPADPRAIRGLAGSYLRLGDPKQALAVIDEFNAKAKRQTLFGLRAQVLWSLGRHDEAEAAVIEGFEKTPRQIRMPELLVTILGQRGKNDRALEILEASRTGRGLDAPGLWQLGRLHLARDEFPLAQARLEEALELEPHRYEVRNDLAFTLAKAGEDLERAVELAREVKALRPDDAAVADTLGFAYYKRGLFDPAAFEFRSAIEQARVNGREVADFHYHLGLVLQAQGRADEARAQFGEALRIEPGHAAAQQAQAQAGAPSDA